MRSALLDYEWQFLLRLVARLGYCKTYEMACITLYEQLRTLIPFYKGVAFRTARNKGDCSLFNSITTASSDGITDHSFFTTGNYPHWSEYIMAPSSIVFRQSDVIAPPQWENTRVYREVWQKQNIYWGMLISVVSKDIPLAIIGFFRQKSEKDFSAREMYILESLKAPLESILYSIICSPSSSSTISNEEKLKNVSAEFSLTGREREIVSLICGNSSDKDICTELFITQATLNKHISNIYKKTDTHSRVQLLKLCNNI